MGVFKYVLPSGAEYTVQAPAGATQAQVDFVFYSQVAAGSLVGYTNGQQLLSEETRLAKFGLSRLDRGTAGVDTLAILAIIEGAPAIAPAPALTNIPLKNPIGPADYALAATPLGQTPVGPLTPDQTQALIAQISNLVDQPADEVTVEKGLGEFGLGPEQLEQAGYLKPGTSDYPDFNCVIGTPSVWTGKNGVYNIADVLSDPALQQQIQTEVMQNSYDALTAGGVIQTRTQAPAAVSTGQIYTAAGLQTLTVPALITGTAALAGTLNASVAKAFAGAPYVSNLLSQPVSQLSTIASGVSGLGTNAINQANNLVNGAIGGTLGQAQALVSGVQSTLNGAVGGLIANASQFSAPVAAAWAKGSALLGSNLGAISSTVNGIAGSAASAVSALTGQATSLVTGAVSQAQGIVTGALGNLTDLASGALSQAGAQAQALAASLGGSLDVFGKMSSFSIDFSLFSSDALVSAKKVAAGFSNTVNRQTVDAAMQRILGNSKIPVPKFEFPSAASLGVAEDIKFAQTKLKELGSLIPV